MFPPVGLRALLVTSCNARSCSGVSFSPASSFRSSSLRRQRSRSLVSILPPAQAMRCVGSGGGGSWASRLKRMCRADSTLLSSRIDIDARSSGSHRETIDMARWHIERRDPDRGRCRIRTPLSGIPDSPLWLRDPGCRWVVRRRVARPDACARAISPRDPSARRHVRSRTREAGPRVSFRAQRRARGRARPSSARAPRAASAPRRASRRPAAERSAARRCRP